jgi:hypothetical protein
MASTPAEGGTPDPQFAAGDGSAADGDSTAEPPLKRARSSSGAMDAMGGGEGTPGLGERCCLACSAAVMRLCIDLPSAIPPSCRALAGDMKCESRRGGFRLLKSPRLDSPVTLR